VAPAVKKLAAPAENFGGLKVTFGAGFEPKTPVRFSRSVVALTPASA